MLVERPRVLAISSSGGHWIQLRTIAGNIQGNIVYVTTSMPPDATSEPLYLVPDANKDRPIHLLKSAVRIVYLLFKLKPSHIVTTGAAPGCLAVVVGKLMGKTAVFVDSIANAETISLSGRIAARLGIVTLTQWPHLDNANGVRYVGSVFGEIR